MLSAEQEPRVTFGFEEFWTVVYGHHQQQFDAITDLLRLANEMLQVAENKAAEPVEMVIHELTRATMAGACDVLLLCGNGCGLGAMKIVRGMYESRWTAEYLRRNPEEVKDYIDFGLIMSWRRYQWLQDNIREGVKPLSSEDVKNIEDAYNRVKPRFTNVEGRVRNQWSKKGIRQIAEEIGSGKEYELPYSLACSIHHANAEGLGAGAPVTPPSLEWVRNTLLAAGTNLWFALNTLNDSCVLGFSDRLNTAGEIHSQVWKE
jgi:hypothetical protein